MCERIDPVAELVDVGLRDLSEQVEQRTLRPWCAGQRRLSKHFRVRELLVQLQRELKARWRSVDPALRDLGPRLAVEGSVHLHRIEVLGVKPQLIEAGGSRTLGTRRWIEKPVPFA